VDGIFGSATDQAIRAFQQGHRLTADGICGQMTWAALDAAVGPKPPVTTLYTVHIPHQSESDADALIAEHPGAWKTGE
jgi:peptidoglycan hydrolase-like protein with peptidoglycan-binding domain